jgi:hypothetical protein
MESYSEEDPRKDRKILRPASYLFGQQTASHPRQNKKRGIAGDVSIRCEVQFPPVYNIVLINIFQELLLVQVFEKV